MDLAYSSSLSQKKGGGGGEEGRKQPVLVGGGSCGLTDAAPAGGGREDEAGHCVFCCHLGSASEVARWWPWFRAQEASPSPSSSPLSSPPGPSGQQPRAMPSSLSPSEAQRGVARIQLIQGTVKHHEGPAAAASMVVGSVQPGGEAGHIPRH